MKNDRKGGKRRYDRKGRGEEGCEGRGEDDWEVRGGRGGKRRRREDWEGSGGVLVDMSKVCNHLGYSIIIIQVFLMRCFKSLNKPVIFKLVWVSGDNLQPPDTYFHKNLLKIVICAQPSFFLVFMFVFCLLPRLFIKLILLKID